MKNTVYGAFDCNGTFLRAGRYLTGSNASKTMNLKNFSADVEIRTLCISATPFEALGQIRFFTEEYKVKPSIIIKEIVFKDGSKVKRVKVNFTE